MIPSKILSYYGGHSMKKMMSKPSWWYIPLLHENQRYLMHFSSHIVSSFLFVWLLLHYFCIGESRIKYRCNLVMWHVFSLWNMVCFHLSSWSISQAMSNKLLIRPRLNILFMEMVKVRKSWNHTPWNSISSCLIWTSRLRSQKYSEAANCYAICETEDW